MTDLIHETACVEPGAVLGEGTRVWRFSHVMAGARIGRGCTLGQNVFVAAAAVIGNGVKVQNNVSVYDGVTLDDDVFCAPGLVFTNVRRPRSPYPRDRTAGFDKTLVRRGATLGANATIVCPVTIGRWAMVAAGAVVTRDVADYALVAGVPAKRIGWACRCGQSLDENTTTGRLTCNTCKRRYQLNSADHQVILKPESDDE